MRMYFEHLDKSSNYLDPVLAIIRKGILNATLSHRNNNTLDEDKITQNLVEEFTVIGSELGKQRILCGQQCKRQDSQCREDLYFYLTDTPKTKIFFAEAKCLPKSGANKDVFDNEYVDGVHAGSINGSPSGGIQRYKLVKHGSKLIRNNAIIAYVKKYTTDEWFTKINDYIEKFHPEDSILLEKEDFHLEYISEHKYTDDIDAKDYFKMHHFWIDLT